jgi:hypothetical protein
VSVLPNRLPIALTMVAAFVVAAPSWATSAGVGTDEVEVVTACATWSHPSPPPGKTDTVTVCGYEATSWRDRVSVDAAGPRRDTHGGSGHGLEAVRAVCDEQQPHLCARTVFQQPEASEDEVAIDLEGGTARLRTVIRDCALDLTVSAEVEDSPTRAPEVYPNASPGPVFVFAAVVQRDGGQGLGTATGTACGWDDVVTGTGSGSLSRERKHTTEGYVFR